jgi:hypothetical protein
VDKRLSRTLCLIAVSAAFLLSACGGHTAAPSSSVTSTTASAVQTPSLGGTTTERVSAWFVDGGHAELARLTAAILAVGHASTFSAAGAACAKLAAAVASAQTGQPVPDPVAQASFASALAEYATSADDCQAGASSRDVALLNKAADATSAGARDILRFDAETEDAQTKEVQSEEVGRCKQLYQAWEDGPAHAEISQFLPALAALQQTDSGNNLPAMSAAAIKAAQPAGQLTRYAVPVCADPAGYFAEILATIRTAAAEAGTAKSQSAEMRALAPLKEVPALENAFTAEVKTATGVQNLS